MSSNVSKAQKDISFGSYGIYKKIQEDENLKDLITNTKSKNENDEATKAAKNTLKLLIDRVTMMDGKKFTKKSWKRLMRTLDTALTARGSKEASARAINRAARQLLADISRLDKEEEKKNSSNDTEKNNKLLTDQLKSTMDAKREATAEKATAGNASAAYEMGKMTSPAVAATAPTVEVTL